MRVIACNPRHRAYTQIRHIKPRTWSFRDTTRLMLDWMEIMNRACLLLLALVILAGCATSRPQDRANAFSTVAFSPDHSLLAFANATEIRVLEVESRTPVNTLQLPPRDSEAPDPFDLRHGVGDTLVFLDDRRIATTGMGGLVSIWDVRNDSRLADKFPRRIG